MLEDTIHFGPMRRTAGGVFIHDDCFNVLPCLADKSIQLILTDLPYGTTANRYDHAAFDLTTMWEHFDRIIKDDGAIVLTASGQFTHKLIHSQANRFKYKWIWVRANAGNFVNANNRPMTKFEEVLVFSKADTANGSKLMMKYNPQGLIPVNKLKKSGESRFGSMHGKRPGHKDYVVTEYTNYPADVLYFDNDDKKRHPNQKPVALFEYLIRTYTDPGDTVIDICGGGATTCIAAERSGRSHIVIEKDIEFFNMGVENIREYEATRTYSAADII